MWGLVSLAVTGHRITPGGIIVTVAWLFRIQLPYERIQYCLTRDSICRVRIGSHTEEEIRRLVLIRMHARQCVLIKVDDHGKFIERVRAYLPNIEVREADESVRQITLNQK